MFAAHKGRILVMLFLVMTVSIFDRQVLSVVAPMLRDQFHLSNTQYGEILFCFLAGMTLGQIPVGILMDRLGPRVTFVILIVVWSSANAAHVFMTSVWQFGVLRFVLGIGECGVYLGGTKVISQFFAEEDRALAAGVFNSGSLAGSILAPPVIVYLTMHYGWKASFLLPSIAGMLWVIPWLLLYSPPKTAHSAQSSSDPEQYLPRNEAVKGSNPSLLSLLAISSVWGVILMRAFGAPVTSFYWYWLPDYLKHQRAMSFAMMGLLSWVPFFTGGIGNIGGGWLLRWLVRRGASIASARRKVLIGSIALSVCVIFVSQTKSTLVAIGLISIASLGINSFAANLMGVMTMIFPENVLGRVASLTGIGDGAMGMVTMLLTGVVVDRFSYTPVFIAAAVLPLLGLSAFLLLIPQRQQQSCPLPEVPAG